MSQPLGWNAVTALGAPWTAAQRTAITVTTTATLLPTTPFAERKGCYLFNAGSVNVFLAFTSDVGTSNEVILYPAQGLFLGASDQVNLYGRTGSSSAVVVVWEYRG